MSTHQAGAFLALWNSISDPRLAREHDTWHSVEHVPERVGLPGFLEARRYRSVDAPLRYFTHYRLDALAALDTPEYRDVFEHPTPWSARMRTVLRDFHRQPCELRGTWGSSSARCIATVCLRADGDALAGPLDNALRQTVLEAGLLSAQWGSARPTSAFPIANQRTEITGAGQTHVLLLQHPDLARLRQCTQSLLQAIAPLARVETAPEFHEWLTSVSRADLPDAAAGRPPPRTDLFTHFNPGDTP
jgi:hypothetical protein